MRKIGMALSVLALAACNSNENNETAASDTSSIMDTLAAGDAKACVDPQVFDIIFDGMLEGTNQLKLLKERKIHLVLEAASMSGRNTDIKEVSCTGSLPAPSRAVAEYTIRPAASGEGITVNWKFPSTSKSDVAGAALFIATERLKRAGLTVDQIYGLKPTSEIAPEEDPTTAADRSDEISYDDPRVSRYQQLETDCRGSTDAAVSEKACPLRDWELEKLHKQGICLGKNGQPDAEFYWHKCGPDSIQEQPL